LEDDDGLEDNDGAASSTTHMTKFQPIHTPLVNPSEEKTRTLGFAAVESLADLADTNPAMALPLFRAAGLHALAFWYSRFEPIWTPSMQIRVILSRQPLYFVY